MRPRFTVLALLLATAYLALFVAAFVNSRSIWPVVAFGSNVVILAFAVYRSSHEKSTRGPWILIIAGIAAIVGCWHDPAHPPGPHPSVSNILILVQALGLMWLVTGGAWLLTRRKLQK